MKTLLALTLLLAVAAATADTLVLEERKFTQFDVHVYFFGENQQSKESALTLYAAFKAAFPDVHLNPPKFGPSGPHPIANWEANPTQAQMGDVIVWLMANHGDHTVLVHPKSGHSIWDHTTGALWFGQKLPLEFNVFHP